MKDKFYASPSNFFKITRTIFRVIIFQDFAAPSRPWPVCKSNEPFWSGRPVVANGKHPLSVAFQMKATEQSFVVLLVIYDYRIREGVFHPISTEK